MQYDPEDWAVYRNLVLKELEDLHKYMNRMESKLDTLREDVIILKVKAGIFGMFAGLAVSVVAKLMGF